MKRYFGLQMIAAIVLLVVTLSLCSFTAAAEQTLYGDADGNDKINAGDILVIRRYLAALPTEMVAENADVNLDGRINAKDLLAVRRFCADHNVVLGNENPYLHDYAATPPLLAQITAKDNTATLSWQVKTEFEDERSYYSTRIYRRETGAQEYTLLGEQQDGLTYIDTSLAADTEYQYALQAVEHYEGFVYNSEMSDQLFAVTLPDLCGVIPTGAATSNAPNSCLLTLEEPDSRYDFVDIYIRKSGEESFEKLKRAERSEDGYTLTELDFATEYFFYIQLVRTLDETDYLSAPSEIISVYTLPPSVESLTAKSGSGKITLSWSQSAAANGYSVYRSTKKDGAYKRITTITGNSYTDSGLPQSTAYYYYITALKSFGSSSVSSKPSKIVSAVTVTDWIRYVYGKSYQGRELVSYIFNPTAKKTLFIDFAVHGFEDESYRDGKVLVNCGNAVCEYYKTHFNELSGWRLVVVPCANPDGVIAGKNNERACATAFGRCTANHIDINRDFYSGGFKAKESQALRDLLKKYAPTRYINFHGWDNETIGDNSIGKFFLANCSITGGHRTDYNKGKGYIIEWVKATFKAQVCLVEFRNSKNVSAAAVEKSINAMLKQ